MQRIWCIIRPILFIKMINNSCLTQVVVICTLSLFNAQNIEAQSELSDTTDFSTTLQEIVVSVPEAIKAGNRDFYYPSEELKKSMSTSSQLLAGLQIPDLIVNPATGDITVSGGGRLSIRINGRPSSQTDLMALSAKDITRVEYISNPGVKYGEASGVLDVAVKRKNDGYGIMVNLLQSPNRGWGDYTVGLKYNTGCSEWSADYHSNPMWRMNCYRDNVENIDPGRNDHIQITESGIETPNRMVTHRASLQYSYAYKSSLLFNVQARLLRQNDRYASIGNITTDFNGTISEGFEKEIAPFTSWQGDLDIYLHWKINSRNKVYFNIVPTILKSDSERIYESDGISIDSHIKTGGYSMSAEGLWEGRIGGGTIAAGIRELLRYTCADYRASRISFREHSSEYHCFAEWNHYIGNFRYIIGIDGVLFNLTDPISKTYLNIMPRLFVRYSPFRWGGISLSLDGDVVIPTVMQLNPTRERIDNYQYSEGNMHLTPYRVYKSSIEFDFNVRDIQGKLSFTDKYSQCPIMGGKELANDIIVQGYYNAGFHNDFRINGQLRMPLFIRNLTLSVEGGWHTMTSKGLNYRHRYSQAFVNAQLMLTAGKWWFMAKYNNAYNMLWGEMISSVNNNLLNLGVGYRYKDVTFMAGIVNPIGNVSLKSSDLSRLAGYERTYHAASTNRLAWVGLSVNLYRGKKRAATQKKLDNTNIYETIKSVQK